MSPTLSHGTGRLATRALLLWVAACGIAVRAAAQGSKPLRKTDVVRLLSSPVIGKGEVADLIRRNCVAFRPTERDWADLRSLGADAEILESVRSCAGRAKAAEPVSSLASTPATAALTLPAATALTIVPLEERILVAPDEDALVRILVKQGGLVQEGVGLVLMGASAVVQTVAPEPQAITDQYGWAEFRLRAGRVAGSYPLRVVRKGEISSRNDPVVELVIVPGSPASADVVPNRLSVDSADQERVEVFVIVKDAFGNPVPDERVDLRGADPDVRVSAPPAPTDSMGRTSFVLAPRTLRRAGRIDVQVRDQRLGSLNAAFTDGASSLESRFVTGAGQTGMPRSRLNVPLIFQARGSAGRPLAGRVVSFTAQNAEITPDHGITDGAGLVEVNVTLGSKSGPAVVIASVDSARAQASLHVQPADPSTVIIEYNGARVDGGRIVVAAESPFALNVSAQDSYGNAVPIAGLARAMEQLRDWSKTRSSLLKIESMHSDNWVTTVKFRPVGRGTAPLRLADATVSVEVVDRAR